jgi:hypothetical protein
MDGINYCHDIKESSHLTVISVAGNIWNHSNVGAFGVSNCNVDSRTSNARFFACWNASKNKIMCK